VMFMWYGYICWIFVLVFEFIWFSSMINSSHDKGMLLFITMIIVATLLVGMTGLALYNKCDK
jgi:membrane protein DedA with SNARE-associated domain